MGLTGCYSLSTATSADLRGSKDVATAGRPLEHVVVSNYGWYFFNRVPIVCGNMREDAFCPWSFFRNEVTTDLVHDRLTSYAAKKKAEVAELQLFFTENVLFEIPGTSIPLPMPYLICYRERLASALLVTPPAAEPKATTPTAAQPVQAEPSHEDLKKRELKKLLDDIPDGGVR